MTNALTTIGPLQEALALATEAGDIDGLRDIAATATAFQKGAKARGMGIDAENTAAEVVLRAERALGRTLDIMSEEGLRRTRGANVQRPTSVGSTATERAEGDNLPGLSDLGITPKEAHLWRTLAAIPESEFEARFATVRDSGARIAKVDFYRLVKGKPAQKPEAERDMHGDGYTSVYTAFHKAALDVLKGIDQMPEDELRDLAATIKQLVTAYNAERARR